MKCELQEWEEKQESKLSRKHPWGQLHGPHWALWGLHLPVRQGLFSHFTDEETEAKRGEVACQSCTTRSQNPAQPTSVSCQGPSGRRWLGQVPISWR